MEPPARPEPAREARIAAIVAEGRATRRASSRATWLLAAIVSAACALGFILLLASGAAREGTPAAEGSAVHRAPGHASDCASGLGLGLGVGLALGIAIGLAIARRQARGHSSRRSP